MSEPAKAPTTKKANKKPQVKKPKSATRFQLLGYFSVDEDRNFHLDSSQLRYFNPPKESDVHLDLDEGIESAIRRKPTVNEEGIDLLLEWIKLNYKKLKANPEHGRFLQPKFICRRGSLVKIFTSPYKSNVGWVIYAAKHKGSIYLCQDNTAYNTNNDENIFQSIWGSKFEQYILSDSPETPPDSSKPVIESVEFRCVYQRRIGHHPVLFSAVRKGVRSETALEDPLPLNKLKFVDTKTTRIVEHAGHEKTLLKHKFLTHWAQCYLTDDEGILYGFRDESGIVQKLKLYSVADMVAASQRYWKPSVCIDFCVSFLTRIADTVKLDYDEGIYKFEQIPNHGINIVTLTSEGQCGFIPESFLEAF